GGAEGGGGGGGAGRGGQGGVPAEEPTPRYPRAWDEMRWKGPRTARWPCRRPGKVSLPRGVVPSAGRQGGRRRRSPAVPGPFGLPGTAQVLDREAGPAYPGGGEGPEGNAMDEAEQVPG